MWFGHMKRMDECRVAGGVLVAGSGPWFDRMDGLRVTLGSGGLTVEWIIGFRAPFLHGSFVLSDRGLSPDADGCGMHSWVWRAQLGVACTVGGRSC